MTFPSKCSLLLVCVLAGGCATLDPNPGFDDVRADVSERANYRVSWWQGSAEDAEAEAALRALLADSLTADEAVQIALLNNRRLQATYAELGVAQAQVVQAGLLGNPLFGGEVVYPLEGGAPNLGFEVAFSFLDLFYLPLRKSVAEAAYAGAKRRVTAEVLDLAADTRAAYYQTQAEAQRLDLLEEVTQAAAAAYEAAVLLHEAGNIPNLDLHNEQAVYEQSRMALLAAQAAYRVRREVLNRLMGLWGDAANWTLHRHLPALPAAPAGLDQLEREAIAASLDLGIIEQDIVTQGTRLGVTRATALVPEMELGGAAEREEGEWSMGPIFHLPIPLFDMGQARVAMARYGLAQQQALYTAQAIDVRAAARTVRERLVAAHRIAAHYRDVVLPLRARILRESQLQYNAMQIGIFQLLQAKQLQVQAAQQYISALEAYWLAQADLDLLRQGRLPGMGMLPGSMMPEQADQVSREAH